MQTQYVSMARNGTVRAAASYAAAQRGQLAARCARTTPHVPQICIGSGIGPNLQRLRRSVERLEDVGVLSLDLLALDLERGRELARVDRELGRQDGELLDALELREGAVRLVERGLHLGEHQRVVLEVGGGGARESLLDG